MPWRLEHFSETQREEIDEYVNAMTRPLRIRFWIVSGALVVGILVGLYFWQHVQEADVRRNCLSIQTGRIEGNKRTKILHDYYTKQLELAKRERPLFHDFISQFPGIEKLIRQSDELTMRLIAAESPLPVPECD